VLIEEAPGGAHRDWEATAGYLRAAMRKHLRELREMSPEQVVQDRYDKFRKIGPITDSEAAQPEGEPARRWPQDRS